MASQLAAQRDQRSRLYGGIMATLGYHIVVSGYGLWLPGDERGHWSDSWDEQVGYIEPHTLHPGDPIRKRMADERMLHPRVILDPEMVSSVVETIGTYCSNSDWKIAAASIEATHTHLLLTYTTREIDNTVKWLKDQTTKAVHRLTAHQGPVWCGGKWRSYVFDPIVWQNTVRYIERHNERRGVGPVPYDFVTPNIS
jgi:REP element-mobilizing transposase RayT